MIRKIQTPLLRDEKGATLVEFGLIAGPFIILMLGLMDLAYQGYVGTLSKSVMHQVARQASVGGKSEKQIENEVKDGMSTILIPGSTVSVNVRSYYDFTSIGKPEKITSDNNKNGKLDSGDCFLDGNKNGYFDVNTGNVGSGGPDDIVNYEVTVTSPRLMPLAPLMGWSDEFVSYNATAVRNQPYGSQIQDPEVCKA